MSATGLPPWVLSAMAVLETDGSDNLSSIGPGVASLSGPITADYQPQTDDVTLGTLRQEKDSFRGAPHGHAGFTCPKCPVPWRRLEGGALGEPDYDSEGKPIQYRKWLNTKRCKTCNTQMKRWTRAKRLNERLQNAHRFFPDSVLAFVTLTKPNVPDLPGRGTLAEEARLMKKQVANFRRGQRMKGIVLGGIDVVENTVKDDGSWNIHHHGIWIMDGYYAQKELDEDWGQGRVHIEKVRKPHATLRYLTSYVSKEPIPGVRCLETFRALRGGAYGAIEDYLASQKECDDAGPASDEA